MHQITMKGLLAYGFCIFLLTIHISLQVLVCWIFYDALAIHNSLGTTPKVLMLIQMMSHNV